MRLTLDSNILVYAFDNAASAKRDVARSLLLDLRDADLVFTAQALAEFANVVRRKLPASYDVAKDQIARWARLYPVLSTSGDDVIRAADFAARHRIQLWDAVIWQVARSGGATLFLSEDLQDGWMREGMTVLNPFNAANSERLAKAIGDAAQD
ncbi:MAG: PIN domain-containing protein [Allosphingosinicella sp.]|uniref:PIN domain-containing protein n=1 Tax=Allosphingosinicella sp. TaxID=2823234 RepID=UPI00393E5801